MKVTCPKCDGVYEFDNEGGLLSCYFCCDEGAVQADVAAEYLRDVAWARYVYDEKAIQKRVALGVPAGWRYYIDEYEGNVVMIPPRELAQPKKADAVSELDDIPF